jgi:hypothetical protein
MSQLPQEYITALIDRYGLDLEGKQADGVVATWLKEYEADWIIKAIVEAVFRGVYKVKTVDGILRQWQRHGKPMCNFKPEFERERLKQISDPADLVEPPTSPKFSPSKPPQFQAQMFPNTAAVAQIQAPLNPEELEPFHHHHQLGATAQFYYAQRGLPQSQVQNSDSQPTESIDNTSDSAAIDAPQARSPLPPDNPNLSTANAAIDPPQPPRLKLLDTLKRAIAGAVTREPGGAILEIDIVEIGIECDDADNQPIVDRSKPGERRQQANRNRASQNYQV